MLPQQQKGLACIRFWLAHPEPGGIWEIYFSTPPLSSVPKLSLKWKSTRHCFLLSFLTKWHAKERKGIECRHKRNCFNVLYPVGVIPVNPVTLCGERDFHSSKLFFVRNFSGKIFSRKWRKMGLVHWNTFPRGSGANNFRDACLAEQIRWTSRQVGLVANRGILTITNAYALGLSGHCFNSHVSVHR